MLEKNKTVAICSEFVLDVSRCLPYYFLTLAQNLFSAVMGLLKLKYEGGKTIGLLKVHQMSKLCFAYMSRFD